MIDYVLTRTRRRTVAIYIRNGGVEVRAPLKTPKQDIDSFVSSKEKWITDKLAKSIKRIEQIEAFALNYGDTVVMRGEKYPIAAKAGNRAGFDGNCFFLPSGLETEQIKTVCIKIYRHLAKIHLPERVRIYAERMGVIPSGVKINGAKTRWGSCSAKKSLNFSWRLIMADDDVIDYVVVHELAHLIEMNHSARFWAVVESVLPDYLERQARLKELQKRLAAEDWVMK